ncbi:Aste57867_16818 [Aphanomyces stellatus]|uniref:Aste57867_16818 protein n=1 Tax=Aphanomyces stellatus TaxID=120398 RepID=A0A485L6F6_9STRA|nr:hypothetical protein As57867_016760 [Aphanomyces stellatus]VFT93583.1 Aste57867_16818 [Aphanomyces stellatus]
MPPARLSEDDEALLAKDRAEHPECTHSTTISSSCRSVNGDRQCEVLRRIFRNCPGRSRELILDSKDNTNDNGSAMQGEDADGDDMLYPFQMFRRGGMRDSHGNMSPFQGGLSGPHPFESMDDLMQEMLRPFGFGGFGGFGSFGRGFPQDGDEAQNPFEPPPRGSQVPPHRSYSRKEGEAKKPARKKDIFDGYDGRVEEI